MAILYPNSLQMGLQNTEMFGERDYVQELTPLETEIQQTINQLSNWKHQTQIKYPLNCLKLHQNKQ